MVAEASPADHDRDRRGRCDARRASSPTGTGPGRDTGRVLAILGGLVAALCWATASMASARAARRIGPWSTLAWVMAIGLVLTAPLMAVAGGDVVLVPSQVALLAVSGISNVAGLLLAYAAVQRGQVALVAPIISTEGALGATIAVAAGEPLTAAAAVVLTVIVLGIVLASVERAPRDTDVREALIGDSTRRAVLLALGAATLFGVNLYASGRIGAELPLAWAILPARVAGTLAVAVPLVLSRRLRLTREAAPWVALTAVVEVVGVASYAFGARDGIAVASVVSSQFGAIAAVASVGLFGERLARVQALGVGLIAAGVAVLSGLQA